MGPWGDRQLAESLRIAFPVSESFFFIINTQSPSKGYQHELPPSVAEQAFTETEKILACGKNRWPGYVTKFLGAMGFLFVLLMLGFGTVLGINALHILPKSQAYTPAAGANATQGIKPGEAKTGVPLPADEYLTPPE